MTGHTYEFDGGPCKLPMTARLVTQGMGYGRYDKRERGWSLTQSDEKPVVEFFDRRYAHTPHGQFISRYRLDTLQAQHDSCSPGLLLDTGCAEWAITAQDLQSVMRRLMPVAVDREVQRAQGLSITLTNRGNPDRGESPDHPLPDTPADFVLPVADLQEASALARRYIEAFDLGGGNWTGGAVSDSQGRAVAHISYNGRVFGAGPVAAEVLEEAAAVGEYPPRDAAWFFEQERRGEHPETRPTAPRPRTTA